MKAPCPHSRLGQRRSVRIGHLHDHSRCRAALAPDVWSELASQTCEQPVGLEMSDGEASKDFACTLTVSPVAEKEQKRSIAFEQLHWSSWRREL